MTAPTQAPPGRLTSISDLLVRTDAAIRRGETTGSMVVPTGFRALDSALTGGLRSGELILFGGAQGLGKTTMVMQMVRNVVHAGGSAVVFSYEQEAHTLLERLIALEAAESAGLEAGRLHHIRQAFEEHVGGGVSIEDRLAAVPGALAGLESIRGYADRLLLHESSGMVTDIEEIERVVRQVQESTGERPLVVVDYLQKVPLRDGIAHTEEDRVTVVVERLKDLALAFGVPIMAIVAADKTGLASGQRMRVQDLRGSTALAYEADVVLILNDKYDVVARHHLVYDVGNADRFRDWVIMTIEKNRHGVDKVDLEFRKQLTHGRFDSEGQRVMEQLIDERVFVE